MVMVVIIACTNLVSDSSLTSLLKFLADGDKLLSSAVIELVVLHLHWILVKEKHWIISRAYRLLKEKRACN